MMPLDHAMDGARLWVVSASEGKPPLGRVEVRTVGEAEPGLVAESCRCGVVEQLGLDALFARVSELDPRFVGYSRGHDEELVDVSRRLGQRSALRGSWQISLCSSIA